MEQTAKADIQPELLVLIEDEKAFGREAQRMAVTWLTAYLEFNEHWVGIPTTEEDRFAVEWARLANVDPQDIVALCPVLFGNGLLLERGEVPEWVTLWIRRRMMSEMTR